MAAGGLSGNDTGSVPGPAQALTVLSMSRLQQAERMRVWMRRIGTPSSLRDMRAAYRTPPAVRGVVHGLVGAQPPPGRWTPEGCSWPRRRAGVRTRHDS